MTGPMLPDHLSSWTPVPPRTLDRRPRDLLGELCTHLPPETVAGLCADLVVGGDPQPWLLPWLAGVPGAHYPAPGWDHFWPRVWGARGLLHVWSDAASGAVVTGVGDPAWRVAEMCLKVSARRELPCGDAAARLCAHDLPRVRATAARALGGCGDSEHLAAVHRLLEDPDPEVRSAAERAVERLEQRLDL